jgi:hypothetical protein
MKLAEHETLVDWLGSQQKEMPAAFPGHGSVNYLLRYQEIEEYLNREVHPHVAAAAMLQDGGYLTDHGPQHIAKIIQRVSRLVSGDECELTPYEVYLLLVAIHFHDVGNIFGRNKHEVKSGKIFEALGNLAGDDMPEKLCIWSIAQAHGGNNGGEKDKISKLLASEPVLGKRVRIQLLAAILKFADELADDKDRAARFLLTGGMLPPESVIYHKYAASLHSVMIDLKGKEVSLHFYLGPADVTTKFGKGKSGKTVYLLDEIFERTMKTHIERIYCSRFLRPHISLDTVKVTIDVHTNKYFEEVKERVGYRLQEKGYPECRPKDIYSICPELNRWRKRSPLNGKNLASAFKKVLRK